MVVHVLTKTKSNRSPSLPGAADLSVAKRRSSTGRASRRETAPGTASMDRRSALSAADLLSMENPEARYENREIENT